MNETIDRKTNINQTVVDILADMAHRDPSEITPGCRLIEDLNFDSLEMVELATELEDVFGLPIPDEDVDKLKTVGSIQAYITANVKTA
ncbi:MAG: acyl carrier protein [bacterium]|nr:acyl carrier protein [bacterium]